MPTSPSAPKKLFRYRSYNLDTLQNPEMTSRLISELQNAENSKIWFSRVAEQNDPFDTRPRYVDSRIKQVKDFYEKTFWPIAGKRASFATNDFVAAAKQRGLKEAEAKKHLRNFRVHIKAARETFAHYRDNHSIACLSEDPVNILMWSYYSSSHQSFSYEFTHTSRFDLGAGVVANVRYVDDRPELSTIDMMYRMANSRFPGQFERSKDEEERTDNATLLCKSTHWAHEQEWRSLKTPDEGSGYHSIAPYVLTGINFGVNADHALIDFVKSNLKHNISFFRCKLDDKEYKINLYSV